MMLACKRGRFFPTVSRAPASPGTAIVLLNCGMCSLEFIVRSGYNGPA